MGAKVPAKSEGGADEGIEHGGEYGDGPAPIETKAHTGGGLEHDPHFL